MPSRDPHPPERTQPLGLHFVIDVVNAPSAAASWSKLSETHGDDAFGRLHVSAGELDHAVSQVRRVLATHDPREAAAALNALLATGAAPPELAELADGRWALRPSLEENAPAAAAFLSTAAFALATWLAERGRCAWGICAAEGCERAFVDEGRRAPQRFCSTACATRTRVAAHRRSVAAARGTDI